jgi:hypothetical protein
MKMNTKAPKDYLFYYAPPRTETRRLQQHLITMEWELKSRLNPENKHGYMKGVHYYHNQVEKTKKLLGSTIEYKNKKS